jgi:hypothetical protein
LGIQVIKAKLSNKGNASVLFNAFLQKKESTRV